MKTYNITPTETKIADYSIKAISLGERGRGRTQVIIPCPDEASTLLEHGLTKSCKPRLNKSQSPAGWLLRISTLGAYIRNARGYVAVHPANDAGVTVIAKGQGAFGDAGRIGTWQDYLIAVNDAAQVMFKVKPTRGEFYLLVVTRDKVSKLSVAEADALDIDYGDLTEYVTL